MLGCIQSLVQYTLYEYSQNALSIVERVSQFPLFERVLHCGGPNVAKSGFMMWVSHGYRRNTQDLIIQICMFTDLFVHFRTILKMLLQQ